VAGWVVREGVMGVVLPSPQAQTAARAKQHLLTVVAMPEAAVAAAGDVEEAQAQGAEGGGRPISEAAVKVQQQQPTRAPTPVPATTAAGQGTAAPTAAVLNASVSLT
jgi:hypothetical protein